MADLLGAAQLGLIRVDEFRGVMKKQGWELTESQQSANLGAVPIPERLWTEAMWTFAEDEQCKWVTIDGRKVCIKPRKPRKPREPTVEPTDRGNHSKSADLARKHAEDCGLDGEQKAKFERVLRSYHSEDLEVKMRSASEGQITEEYGELVMGYYDENRDEIVLLRGWEIEAVDHEMGHSIAHRVFGTTRPEKYRKYLKGEYAEAIKNDISAFALEHEGEVLAYGFEFMRKNPAEARRLMRENPLLKECLSEIIKDTRYSISWTKGR